jgi:hypothetical protein
MARARKKQKNLPGVDILWGALARTTELAASLTAESIDSVFRVFGVVSERDLQEIRRTMARIETRLARIESKRGSSRVAAAAAAAAAEARDKDHVHAEA